MGLSGNRVTQIPVIIIWVSLMSWVYHGSPKNHKYWPGILGIYGMFENGSSIWYIPNDGYIMVYPHFEEWPGLLQPVDEMEKRDPMFRQAHNSNLNYEFGVYPLIIRHGSWRSTVFLADFPIQISIHRVFFHIFPWSFHDFRIFPIFSYFRFPQVWIQCYGWQNPWVRWRSTWSLGELGTDHGFTSNPHGGFHKWGFIMEKPIKMDGLGYPHFRKPGYEDLHDIFWGNKLVFPKMGDPQSSPWVF